MRNLIILIGVFLVSGAAVGQPAVSNDELAIVKVLDEQTAAWNKGHLEDFMQGYWKHDSLMFIGRNGINWGWQKTLENYKRGYPDTAAMGKLSFNVIVIKKLSADYYYVVGKWMLTRTVGDVSGHFNLLFQKINGKWLIVADHSS